MRGSRRQHAFGDATEIEFETALRAANPETVDLECIDTTAGFERGCDRRSRRRLWIGGCGRVESPKLDEIAEPGFKEPATCERQLARLTQ